MSVKILIPYNFTENDKKAVDFVGLKYKGLKEVDITLFHAHMPVPLIDEQEKSPVMKKVVHNTAYLRQRQEERYEALKGARTRLINQGLDGHHIQCVYRPVKKDVAADIISLWKEGKYDVVVLSRNPGNIVNFFTRSISKRIVRQCGLGVHIIN